MTSPWWNRTLDGPKRCLSASMCKWSSAAVRTVDEVVRDQDQIDRRAIQWISHPDLGDIPLHASPIRWHESDLVDLVANRPLGADNNTVLP